VGPLEVTQLAHGDGVGVGDEQLVGQPSAEVVAEDVGGGPASEVAMAGPSQTPPTNIAQAASSLSSASVSSRPASRISVRVALPRSWSISAATSASNRGRVAFRIVIISAVGDGQAGGS
jgi:hypothetical protein